MQLLYANRVLFPISPAFFARIYQIVPGILVHKPCCLCYAFNNVKQEKAGQRKAKSCSFLLMGIWIYYGKESGRNLWGIPSATIIIIQNQYLSTPNQPKF